MFAGVAIYNFHYYFFFSSLTYFFFTSFTRHFGSKTNKKYNQKCCLFYCLRIWIAKFLLPIYCKESSHLPVAQWGFLHYAKTLHTASSSIIYTFIVHYPNHLPPWEIQKFSYASLIHSRYANLDGVLKKLQN